jgi:hypothetical protein
MCKKWYKWSKRRRMIRKWSSTTRQSAAARQGNGQPQLVKAPPRPLCTGQMPARRTGACPSGPCAAPAPGPPAAPPGPSHPPTRPTFDQYLTNTGPTGGLCLSGYNFPHSAHATVFRSGGPCWIQRRRPPSTARPCSHAHTLTHTFDQSASAWTGQLFLHRLDAPAQATRDGHMAFTLRMPKSAWSLYYN